MTFQPGTRLGNYEVLGELGSGGMGEVYKARDLKLGREVAIKVLPQEMAADAQRLRRFEQEARAASALNHPNIVTIYEIGEHEGTPYIAMEYVEGRSLREILTDGPLPNDKLIRYATQMAEGLAKAHQAGIVHRDLKPENIVVSDDGYVKLLDFGLAKLLPEGDVGAELSTLAKDTTPGAILGTVGYMSPEQAKGESADFRSDQFSLGAILYEMATGHRAFERDSSAQTLAAIIEHEPQPVTLSNPSVPGRLASVIDRCLSKGPRERYESTWAIAKQIHEETLRVAEPRRKRYPLAVAGVGGLLAIVVVMILGLFVSDIRELVFGEADIPVIESIAVLPLENLSDDPEQEYFADGMTDTLISDLGKIEALKVISRTSVMQYKGARRPLPEIAQALGVNGVVTGSVFREGDRVRITVQLVEAPNDRLVWTESYERELTSILSLQGEVARAIAREIEVSLTPVEEARLTDARVVDKDVQDAYFRGRFFAAKDNVEGVQRALGYFQEAIEKEPDYPLAHAALAQAYSSLGFFGAVAPRDAYPKAKAAAHRALEHEELAEAHATLGYIAAFYEWDWTSGEREFTRAIELNPNYAAARLYYHWLLTAEGRQQDAAQELQTALELDPLSLTINANVAWHAARSGEQNRGIAEATKTLELEPGYTHALWFRGIAYLQADRLKEATADFEAATAISETLDLLAWLGYAYALAGRREEALAVLSKLEVRSESSYVPADRIAIIHIGLGDLDRAFDYLEKGFEERAGFMVYLKIDPVFDPLRDDPRFQDLLRRMNFPD